MHSTDSFAMQGLGKTVQMLALIVSAPPTAQEAEDALENAERTTRNAEALARDLAGNRPVPAPAAVGGAAAAAAAAEGEGPPASGSGRPVWSCCWASVVCW